MDAPINFKIAGIQTMVIPWQLTPGVFLSSDFGVGKNFLCYILKVVQSDSIWCFSSVF